MVRSFQGKPVPMRTASTTTGTIQIYDPAMCCSTGLCGPSVDTQLLQVARDLRRFEGEGIKVERFNLSQQPGAFVENKRVAGLLQAFGEEALPVSARRHPNRQSQISPNIMPLISPPLLWMG